MHKSAFIIIGLLVNMVLNALASILTKIATHQANSGGGLAAVLLQPLFYVALVSFGLSFVAYTFVLRNMNVNLAYPIVVSGSLIIVTILGTVILKEPTSIVKLIGGVIVLVGIWLLSVG